MYNAEKLVIQTIDYGQTVWMIDDATGVKFSTSKNGYLSASWNLPRPFGQIWPDLGLNYQVFIKRGLDTWWHGRLDGITQNLNGGAGTVACTAVGYWASTYDLTYTGTLSGSASPETMIGTLVSGGYTPQLSSTTSLAATSVTTRYSTGNNGTDDEFVGDIIQALCKNGTSTGLKVFPAVFNNRQLTTYTVSATPTADYIIRRKNVQSISLRTNLSGIYNEVIARYKDANGNLARVTVDDTTGQALLGMNYGSGVVNFKKAKIGDVTGLSNTSSTIATNYANAYLTEGKRIKSDSQGIVIKDAYSLYDVAQAQQQPLYAMRAGKWLQIPDLFFNPGEIGVTSTNVVSTLSTFFFISQTDYDVDSGTLTLTPETSSNLETLVG